MCLRGLDTISPCAESVRGNGEKMKLYPEFTPIYIGMTVILAVVLVVLVLQCIVLAKVSKIGKPRTQAGNAKITYNNNAQPVGKVVFCPNCATEFDASEKCCPKCGAMH